MTWIRFGRNETVAPTGPLLDRDGRPLDLRAYAGGCALLIWFAPRAGLTGCAALLADLRAAAEAEQDAQALVVSPVRADHAAAAGLTVGYDNGGRLLAAYRALLEFDTGDGPLLFVLDRDGAPVYAWLGACDESSGLRDELARRLQSAAFLCPECSVPDPAAGRTWDVIY
jgi:peroxiredoxin